MSTTAPETLSVIVEREVAYPPEKIWRALTQPHLIEEWLMKNDFRPAVGHPFKLSADWGSVDCEVLAIEPITSLIYSWSAMGVGTVVTWTLTPTSTGTHLRMVQAGFSADAANARYYQGAQYGWQQFFGKLEAVLAKAD
jgi:uncharacterized protein YndB with AHSA1/START domain